MGRNRTLNRDMIIYKATNKINGKIYIGKTTTSLKQRMSEHKRRSKTSAMTFHLAIQKYGFKNFVFEQIAECNNWQELNKQEIELIAKYNSIDPNLGYNRSIGGNGVGSGENHPLFGKKRPEFSEKISGKNHPNYGNTGKLSPRFGQTHSEKTKNKIRKSMIGKMNGENNPQYDTDIYQFKHKEFGTKICTKYELRKEFNLDSKCIALLCRGERNIHKGWEII